MDQAELGVDQQDLKGRSQHWTHCSNDKCRAPSNKTETKEKSVDWHSPVPLPSCFLCIESNVRMVALLSDGGSPQTTASD